MTRNAKILIVEDEIILAASIERELSRRGYRTCESACSEGEALEKVKTEQPDLILMDCCLGCENSGFDAARRIRSICVSPIVFMSGLEEKEIEDQLGAFERCAFLAKPFNPEALVRIIETTLDAHAQRSGSP